MNRLDDKVVLITGGSSGLGEQIAYESAKRGATVIVCARRVPELISVCQKCEELSGNKAYYYELNIAKPERIEEVCQEIFDVFPKVDILVNNAGFGLFRNFLEFDMATAEQMFRVNVLGLMYLTQKIVLKMAGEGHGHIINIASQAAKMATQKSTIYSATKFAVLGFSNALRLELKPLNIYVTTVNPGPIETNFFNIADESGNYLKSIDAFVLDPVKLGRQIVNSFNRPKREINAPGIMEVASILYTLFPHIGDILAASIFNRK